MYKLLKSVYHFFYRHAFQWGRFFVFRFEDLWFSKAKSPVITCLGDSHTMVFSSAHLKKMMRPTRLRAVTVMGATAFGLGNPNSKTNAVRIFKRELRFMPRRQKLIFLLGEVDCGFLIWYRANRYSTPVGVQLAESLARYTKLLKLVSDWGFVEVAVFSVPPPTIGDGQQLGLVANLRRTIAASQLERTQITKEYNVKLREMVLSLGFDYIDIYDDLVDPETELVRDDLKSRDVTDHHLSTVKVSPIYAEGLKRFIATKD